VIALLSLGWLVLGGVLGLGIRRANVWLAPREEVTPGFERWQVWGPPALAAVLFAAFAARAGLHWRTLLVDSLWVAVLVQVIFFDFEHHLILDRVLLPSALLAILLSVFAPPPGWRMALLGGVVGGLFFLLIALVGSLLLRQEAMGLGDVKLVAFLGLILGLFRGDQAHFTSPLLSALLVGVVLGGLVAVVFRLRKLADAIAYGPFLAAGALITLFALGPQ
jgi:leader peptidase (prepilin peptidase) / N-methyltransferase